MYEFIRYLVADVMSSKPVTVARETTIAEVERIFRERDFSGIPVVDSEHQLEGLVTKLDVLKAFSFTNGSMVPRYQEILQRTIESVMIHEPIVVVPDMPLTRVLQKMVEMRYHCFPVTDNDAELLGIITRRDLLRALELAAQGIPPQP